MQNLGVWRASSGGENGWRGTAKGVQFQAWLHGAAVVFVHLASWPESDSIVPVHTVECLS